MCNKESFWPILCHNIGRKELSDDPRFINFKTRQENRDEVTKILDEEFMKKATSEWLEKFAGIVPAAPILDLKEALENPFLDDRSNIQKLKTKNGEDISLLKTPIHVSSNNFEDKTAPELGADTNSVLEEAGFTHEEINTFKTEGII